TPTQRGTTRRELQAKYAPAPGRPAFARTGALPAVAGLRRDGREEVGHLAVEHHGRLEIEAVAATRDLHQARPGNVARAEVGVGRRDQTVAAAGDHEGRGGDRVQAVGRPVPHAGADLTEDRVH